MGVRVGRAGGRGGGGSCSVFVYLFVRVFVLVGGWRRARCVCVCVCVFERPPRERKVPGSNSACVGIFSGSSHTSDLKIGTPVATFARRLAL